MGTGKVCYNVVGLNIFTVSYMEAMEMMDERHYASIGTVADMPLVVTMAKKVMRRHHNAPIGLELEDLLQIGWMTLNRCIKSYSADYVSELTGKSVKWGTYLGSALFKEMEKAVKEAMSPIHIPQGVMYAMDVEDREYNKLICSVVEGEAPPSWDDFTKVGSRRMTQHQLLDEKEEYIPAKYDDTRKLDADVEVYLSKLTDAERRIVRMKLGIDAERPLTFKEIGRLINPPVSRGRVEQLYKAALAKLRTVA